MINIKRPLAFNIALHLQIIAGSFSFLLLLVSGFSNLTKFAESLFNA